MQEKDDGFQHGQMLRTNRVDEEGHESDGNGKESPMPLLRYVVRVVEKDNSLKDSARSKSGSSNSSLPAQGGEPTYAKSEGSLDHRANEYIPTV